MAPMLGQSQCLKRTGWQPVLVLWWLKFNIVIMPHIFYGAMDIYTLRHGHPPSPHQRHLPAQGDGLQAQQVFVRQLVGIDPLPRPAAVPARDATVHQPAPAVVNRQRLHLEVGAEGLEHVVDACFYLSTTCICISFILPP